MWLPAPGLSIRRLVRDAGIVPIPGCLPGYRVALSPAQNRASLAIGKRVTTTGIFAPGMSVLGQPGDIFDGEMRDRVDVLLFLMQPLYVTAQLESRGLPGDRAELRDLPPRLDIGLLECGTLLANALSRGLSGDELYCEILLEAMITRIISRHSALSFGRTPYRESLSPAKLRTLVFYRRQFGVAPAAWRFCRCRGTQSGTLGTRVSQRFRHFIASLRLAPTAAVSERLVAQLDGLGPIDSKAMWLCRRCSSC
jgi:hypothetical protein